MPLFKIQTLHKVGHRISMSICLCFFFLFSFFHHGWTIKSYPTDQENICVFCFVFFTWFSLFHSWVTEELCSTEHLCAFSVFLCLSFLSFPTWHVWTLFNWGKEKICPFFFARLFLSSSLPNWQLFTATLLSHQTPLLSAGISVKSTNIWYLVMLARNTCCRLFWNFFQLFAEMILRKALVSKAWLHFGRQVQGCVSTSLCSRLPHVHYSFVEGIWKCTHARCLYLAY